MASQSSVTSDGATSTQLVENNLKEENFFEQRDNEDGSKSGIINDVLRQQG